MNKNKTKKIMLMLSIVFVFLLIGSASAADDIKVNQTDSIGDEILTSDNNDVDLVSSEDTDENTDVLTDDNTVGSFSDLEKDINAEKGYQQTVYLTKDYVFNEDSDSEYKTTGVYIGSYTTIDGQNHIIDAKNAQYIFNTIGQFITLKNIKFKNTSTRGINVASSDVSIIHCTFDNNTGRAVGIEDTGVDCLIDDCTFTNGQGVSTVATGTKIKNSVFENNYASNGGAVNIQSKEVIIDTCTFTGNNATNGGAIYFYYNNNNEGNEVLTIINSIFNENNANTGGAIYHQNKYIKTSSIYQNLGNIINITSSTFTKNRAVQYREIYGDYINDDSSTFDGGRYYQNETSIFDGVTKGTITMEDDITLIRGPIVLDLTGSLTINGQGKTIDANGNQAFYIKSYSKTELVLTIKNLTIKNGHANEGGAIYMESNKGRLPIQNCTFINNTATNGGAIYSYSNAATGRLSVTKSNFINNSATNYGGAIYASGSMRLTTFSYSIYDGNSANLGGVIYMNRLANPPTITGNTFINNYADTHAVFYNQQASIGTTKNNVFRNNKALSSVLNQIPVENNDIDDSNIIVFNLTFTDNEVVTLSPGDYHVDGSISTAAGNITLDGNGARLYNFDFSMHTGIVKNLIIVNGSALSLAQKVEFENVTFINCTDYCLNLKYGGKVKDCVFINCTSPITNQYSVNITNTKFDELIYNDVLLNQLLTNSTTNNTVIRITPNNYDIVSSISIFGNNITIDGQESVLNSLFGNRVFNVYGKNITIKNFNIKNTNNQAIYFQGWHTNNPPKTWVNANFLYIGEVSNVNFINCTTSIYFEVANGTVSDCTFIDGSGRQIYFGANGTVINSEFENITAYSGGASVYFKESGIVKDSNFINTNAISAKGGAIYFNQNGTVENSNFINNKAVSGGAIYQSNPDGAVIVNKSNFNGNVAKAAAGAIYCEGSLIIADTEFENNTADVGGAVSSITSLTVDNSTFSNNTATLAAGISSKGDNVVISNSAFTSNVADVGAAVYSQGDDLNIVDSNFTENTANFMGSTIMSEGNNAVIDNVRIEGNTAPDASAIVLNGDNAKITQSTIQDNIATTGEGSVVTINGNGAEISNTTLTGNDGTAIESNGNGTVIKDNTIENNNGIGIEINGKNTNVDNNTLAGTNGDALVINGENTTAVNNGISNTTNGSGVVINAVDSTVKSNTFENNTQNNGDITVTDNAGMSEEDIEQVKSDNNDANVLKDAGVNIIIEPSIVHVDENLTLTVTTETQGTVRILIGGREVYLGEITQSYTYINEMLPVGDYLIFVGFTPNDSTFASRDYSRNVHVQNWNFTELQGLINNPDENGTVNLGNHTFVRENGEDVIHVDSPVTINGNGSTIDAGNQGSIFEVTADNVVIKDMDLVNTRDSAISSFGANTTIESVDVINSTGTAITLTGENATIKEVTLEHVDNGIIINANGTADISGVKIDDASGKAIDVVADNVNIENTNLTNVNKGIDATATTGDAKVDNVVVDGADSDAILVKAENGTASVTGSEVKNVTDGAAITVTGKDVTVADTNMSNVDKGASVTATAGDAKVENINVDGASDDAVTVKAENGTASVSGAEVNDVNGTAITVTGKEASVTDANISNVDKGADITATAGDVKAENITVSDATGDAVVINATNGNADVSDVVLNNVTGDNGLKVESETATVDDVTLNGGAGENAVNVETTGDAKVSNVELNDYNGTGVNAQSSNGDVEVINTTAVGGEGTAVKVNASNGNATVSGTDLTDYTGKSAEVTAANATVSKTSISGGNTSAPVVNATNRNVDPVSVDADKAFTIPDTESSSPVFAIDLPSDATGEFIVKVDGVEKGRVNLTNGKASITVPNLSNGKHAVEVEYSGDANYAGVKKSSNITVSRKDVTITAANAAYVINYGGAYSVTLSSKVAGQSVTFTINGKTYTAATDANGIAVITLTKAMLGAVGVKNMVIDVAGDANYNPATKTVSITVNKEAVKITGKSVKKTYKKSKVKKLKITLKNSKNKALSGKFKVTLKVNKKLKGKIGKTLKKGKIFNVKFNKKGIGYITLKNNKVKGFKKGTYKFTVIFKGNGLYKAATKKNIKMKIK